MGSCSTASRFLSTICEASEPRNPWQNSRVTNNSEQIQGGEEKEFAMVFVFALGWELIMLWDGFYL